MVQNHSLIFNEIPTGYPVPGQTLKKTSSDIDLDQAPPQGSVLVKVIALSLDPYQRGRMRSPEKKSYSPPFDLGKPITNAGVAQVLKSSNASFKEGQHIYGMMDFSEYNIIPEQALARFRVLDNKEKIPWTTWTGACGMPGQTAYYGLESIAKPKKGETIFISGASGAVGQIVAAIAKRAGCKVIGSAGSDDKVAFLKDELKFDVAFNYKTESTQKILEQHPFDIYWDNVGGETLDIVLATINKHGRIVACGAISGYNGESYPIKNWMNVIGKEILIKGFIVSSDPSFLPNFYRDLPAWVASGEVVPKEHVYKGLDNGEAFLDLMKGGNFGKAVISFE